MKAGIRGVDERVAVEIGEIGLKYVTVVGERRQVSGLEAKVEASLGLRVVLGPIDARRSHARTRSRRRSRRGRCSRRRRRFFYG